MQQKEIRVSEQEIKESIRNTYVNEEQAKPVNKTGFTLWQVLNQNSWDTIHKLNKSVTVPQL